MKNKKSILWITMIILIVIMIIINKKNNLEKNKNQDILKIGVVIPLSGDSARYGEAGKNSFELAKEEINKNGGINNKKVEIIYEDGKCNGKDAINAAKKLLDIDKVNFISGSCSGESIVIVPIANKYKVISFSAFSTSPLLSGISTYFFRNATSDASAAKILAKTIGEKNKKLAIISQNTDYAEALKIFLSKDLKENYKNLEIVSEDNFITGTKDFRSIFLKIKEKNPDAIFINPQDDTNAINLIKQFYESGLSINKTQIYMNIFPDGSAFISSLGDKANGIIYTNAPGLSESNKSAQDFLKNYQAKYKTLPIDNYLAGASFDFIYIIKKAVESVGLDKEKLADYLHGLKDFKGIIGEYGFDNKGDISGIDYILKKIENGKVVLIK